ncbi:hypothetical protein HDU93_003797 [Gonapodya sp. JEL0774]|nr:hypothetical protein HDU93_003797 [Gonapodya sp. JEL0774]
MRLYKKLKRDVKEIAAALSTTQRSPTTFKPPVGVDSSPDSSSSTLHVLPIDRAAEFSSLNPSGLKSARDTDVVPPVAGFAPPRRGPTLLKKIGTLVSFAGNRTIRRNSIVDLTAIIPTLLPCEREFFEYLDTQLDEVNAFFVEQSAFAESRLSAILEQLTVLKELQANPQLLADERLPLIGIEVQETASVIKSLSSIPRRLIQRSFGDKAHKSISSRVPPSPNSDSNLERGLFRRTNLGQQDHSNSLNPHPRAPQILLDPTNDHQTIHTGDQPHQLRESASSPDTAVPFSPPPAPVGRAPSPSPSSLTKRKNDGADTKSAIAGRTKHGQDDISKRNEDFLNKLGLDQAVSRQGLEVARSKLKKAVLEYYRFLTLLRNFQTLNSQAFGKIMKKYEKYTGWGALPLYMAKVNKREIVTSRKLDELERKTEACFAKYFTDGDQKDAKKRLRLPESRRDEQFMTTWMTGILIGLSVPPILFGLERSLLQTDSNARFLLQAYGGFGVVVVLLQLFSLYTGMIANAILRITWVFSISPSHWGIVVDGRVIAFFLALLEVFRRFQWNVFRMENEHLTNVGNFRAVKDIPLPLKLNRKDNNDDWDDKEDKGRVGSGLSAELLGVAESPRLVTHTTIPSTGSPGN